MPYKNPEDRREYAREYRRRVKNDPAKLEQKRACAREHCREYRRRVKNDPAKLEQKRACEREQNREHYRRIKNDPAKLEQRRACERENTREYRRRMKNDPAKLEHKRAYAREYYRRIQNDPVKREQRRKWQADRRKKDNRDRTNYWKKLKADPVRIEQVRDKAILRIHGLTPAQYRHMLIAQKRCCAICGATTSGNQKSKRLHVDHCHKTGEIRGLLCNACNTGLGMFRDDRNLLRTAIAYLEKRRRNPKISSSFLIYAQC